MKGNANSVGTVVFLFNYIYSKRGEIAQKKRDRALFFAHVVIPGIAVGFCTASLVIQA